MVRLLESKTRESEVVMEGRIRQGRVRECLVRPKTAAWLSHIAGDKWVSKIGISVNNLLNAKAGSYGVGRFCATN